MTTATAKKPTLNYAIDFTRIHLDKLEGEHVEWKDASRFEALADYVLIGTSVFDKTTGGIYRPENSVEETTRVGVVLSVGPGHSNMIGGFVPTTVQVGELVIGSFPEHAVDSWVEGDYKFYVVREQWVTGRVKTK